MSRTVAASIQLVFVLLGTFVSAAPAEQAAELFPAPARRFISLQQPHAWEEAIFTGNGTMGALVMGDAYDETIYLSHASLYLPRPASGHYIETAARLSEIRKLCLEGNYNTAGELINSVRKETGYFDQRDPFIAAFNLRIKQPKSSVVHYERAVDYMTAEAFVSVTDGHGSFRRSTFISRSHDVIVLQILGSGKQSAEISFAALPPVNDREKNLVTEGVTSSEQYVKDGYLYFRTLFAVQNKFNPLKGYEGLGKVVAKNGSRTESASEINVVDADEILVLVKIRPLLKEAGVTTNADALQRELDALPTDYKALLAPHAKIHGDLMSRVSLSLDAPKADRAKPSEVLNKDSETLDAPLAKIERAFDAGRYNIICSTGLNPPNLQGLWSGTWLAPWSGSFTTNGNLPCAISFLLMGNTPELIQPYFQYYDDHMAGFRDNAKALYGTRGFHVPTQLTVSPRETDFSAAYPLNYWHSGAAWACQFYYDYYQYTGDENFLAQRAYPLMKVTASFYEDFLAQTDQSGKWMFVPSYSPENAPANTKVPTAVNATMDIAAAKQLLRSTSAAAKHLGRDEQLQKKWSELLAKMPDYQVAPDGSFREWLWPGLEENNQHRHASHLYALYDEMPVEIVNSPAFVKAVEHTVRERLKFQKRTGVMAFGLVLIGLAAEHIGNAELTEEIIDVLAKYYWSSGMASFHNRGSLFNMDISGGFPYLCASALVYSEPGLIRLFPAKPVQWTRGSLKGVRLRGGILVRELSWDGPTVKVVLVSDKDQTVLVASPTTPRTPHKMQAGIAVEIDL